jgi:hypothetical protein
MSKLMFWSLVALIPSSSFLFWPVFGKVLVLSPLILLHLR